MKFKTKYLFYIVHLFFIVLICYLNYFFLSFFIDLRSSVRNGQMNRVQASNEYKSIFTQAAHLDMVLSDSFNTEGRLYEIYIYKNKAKTLVFKLTNSSKVLLKNILLFSDKSSNANSGTYNTIEEGNFEIRYLINKEKLINNVYINIDADTFIPVLRNDSIYATNFSLKTLSIDFVRNGPHYLVATCIRENILLDRVKLNFAVIKKYNSIYLVFMYPINEGDSLNANQLVQLLN